MKGSPGTFLHGDFKLVGSLRQEVDDSFPFRCLD